MSRKVAALLGLTVCAAALTAGVSLAAGDGRYGDDTVAMPREVIAAASAFCSYVEHAAAASSRLTSGAAVGDGLKAGAAYEPGQFEEGMIGYASLAALRDDRFIAGVAYAARVAGRRELIARLAADPTSVLRIDGADEAALGAQAALRERGEALAKAGGRTKQAAYDVQRERWSKAKVADHAQRLAGVKSLSARPFEVAAGDDARLIEAVLRIRPPAGVAQTASPIVVRGLALAAEAALGAARAEDLASLRPLLSEASSARCLRMSKLNLYQCMAVAGPQYEDVFCLGQHELIDTAQCVADASGVR
jgi:hypothetical protein